MSNENSTASKFDELIEQMRESNPDAGVLRVPMSDCNGRAFMVHEETGQVVVVALTADGSQAYVLTWATVANLVEEISALMGAVGEYLEEQS